MVLGSEQAPWCWVGGGARCVLVRDLRRAACWGQQRPGGCWGWKMSRQGEGVGCFEGQLLPRARCLWGCS